MLLIILLDDKTPEAPIAGGVPVRSHYMIGKIIIQYH